MRPAPLAHKATPCNPLREHCSAQSHTLPPEAWPQNTRSKHARFGHGLTSGIVPQQPGWGSPLAHRNQ
eukprot:15459800-Alexandrium_andersonii.AAC.1